MSHRMHAAAGVVVVVSLGCSNDFVLGDSGAGGAESAAATSSASGGDLVLASSSASGGDGGAPPVPREGASCRSIKLVAPRAPSGVYTITPSGADPVKTYCDMVTDGGGWTLVAYAQNAWLGGRLDSAGGSFAPLVRSGSAHIDAQSLATVSIELAYAWSDRQQMDDIGGYDAAIKHPLPEPDMLDLNPGSGASECLDTSTWALVNVTCLHGTCDLPATMYTRKRNLGVCFGEAYGLVTNEGTRQPSCDWRIDDQPLKAIYVQVGDQQSCAGIVPEPGGAPFAFRPSTVAMWMR